jgi:3',5'-cyclic AMP phosphodiesterase CpdA
MPRDRCLNRRDLLRQSAGTLLAAGLWPGSLCARATASGEFDFLVINDIHYHDTGCGRWLAGIIREMKKRPERLQFCLLVGDLAEVGTPEQLEPVRDLFRTLGSPVHVVIGNHDYRTNEDRKPFEDVFPGSLNYHFEHAGWQVIGLDSSYGRRTRGAVQPPTLRWLDDTLPRLDKHRPTILFTHYPLGPWVLMRATNADEVLDRFRGYNLQAVFNGHFHGLTERHVRKTVLTTNRCCSLRKPNHDGTKEKGYFLCRARDGKVTREFIEVPLA